VLVEIVRTPKAQTDNLLRSVGGGSKMMSISDVSGFVFRRQPEKNLRDVKKESDCKFCWSFRYKRRAEERKMHAEICEKVCES